MFRTIRPLGALSRRAFWSSSRFSGQGTARDVRIQRVRILQPFITPKRIQRFFMYSLLIILAKDIIKLADDGDDEDEDTRHVIARRGAQRRAAEGIEAGKEDMPEIEAIPKALLEDEQPGDAIFIPLWFAHQRPQSYYKGTDPEWLEFVKFSRDRERNIEVRRELAEIALDYSAESTLVYSLGTPLQLGRFWLDVDFPPGPPKEYERRGLEIADDYIAVVTRPVTETNYHRLQDALWPSAFASSIWASTTALVAYQWAQVKAQFTGRQGQNIPPPSLGIAGPFRNPEDQDKSATGGTGSGTVSDDPTGSKDSDTPNNVDVRVPVPVFRGLASNIQSAFFSALGRAWQQQPVQVPRGSLVISGLVEVLGTKSNVILEVQAAYNPKDNDWPFVGLGVRRFQRKRQSPHG